MECRDKDHIINLISETALNKEGVGVPDDHSGRWRQKKFDTGNRQT